MSDDKKPKDKNPDKGRVSNPNIIDQVVNPVSSIKDVRGKYNTKKQKGKTDKK